MTRFHELDALLDQLLDLPAEECDAFVDRVTATDPSLRAELWRRLDAHRASGDFLERPAIELAAPLLLESREADNAFRTSAAPERVGPYRIVRELGHGGMGAVFLAERDDGQFEQRVALKLVRHTLANSAELSARFMEERRILAVLEHPGIARLLDGGVSDTGVPWFAMEYIDGEPLDAYCDTHGLSVKQRLSLFGAVCEAVQYAHQHLVVHRDLKPSNILVTNDGVVKLLDFGIAKLVDPLDSGDDATRTAWHAMTPQYAAPEQVRGEPVSTATDVYALGVVLYELVTGQRPYELRGLTPAELEHTVCDLEPPKPSTTFGADDNALDTRADRARVRGSTTDRLRRLLHGDIDAITMQALRKEPARRYPSASALVDDVRRFCDGMPVVARTNSAGYRFRKFAGRHRGALAVAASMLLLLTSAYARERVMRARAEGETRKAKAVEAYVVGIFDGSDPFSEAARPGEELTARALLDRGAQRVGAELATQPEVEAEMRGVIGRVYTSLGVFDKAEAQGRQSLARRRALYGTNSASVAEAMDQLGVVLQKRYVLPEAERLLQESLAMRRALLGPDDSATAESLDHLTDFYQEKNDFNRALGYAHEAVESRRRSFGDESPKYATSLVNLALLLWWKEKFDEAEPILRRALAIETRTLGENAVATAQTLHNLAQVLEMRSHYDEAEIFYRRALAAKRKVLGNAHPTVTVNLNNLGIMLATQLERPAEGEPLIREALALDRQMFGKRHGYVSASLTNLAAVLRMKGDFEEAERSAREALDVDRSLFTGDHSSLALDMNAIGAIRHLKGDLDGAIPMFRESHAQFKRLLGPAHMSTLSVANSYARVLRESGHTHEAEQIFRDNATHLDSTQKRQRAIFISARVGLGRTLASEGRDAEAIDVLRGANDMVVTQYKKDNWHIAEARLALGKSLVAVKKLEDARPLLEQARASLDGQRRAQPRLAAEADSALQRLSLTSRRTTAARE
ncbi:MAG: serine/threonine-protein kinase [bacterium]